MQDTITAGAITNLIKSFTDGVFKYLGTDTNGESPVLSFKYHDKIPFTVEITPIDEKNSNYVIALKDKPSKSVTFKDTPNDKMDDVIETAMKKLIDAEICNKYGIEIPDVLSDDEIEDYYEQMLASHKVSVTLQKIISAKKPCVEYKAIKADCDPTVALTILDTVLDDNDFQNIITDEPVSFQIIETDNDYEVETCSFESDTVEDALTYMLNVFASFYYDFQMYHIDYVDDEDLYEYTWQLLDICHEYIEYSCVALHDLCNVTATLSNVNPYNGTYGLTDCIEQFMDNLEYSYINLPDEVKPDIGAVVDKVYSIYQMISSCINE